MDGFANPGSCSLLEEWGAKAVIAVNPGVDIHWGTCTTVWGSPDLDDLPRKPTIAVVAVNNPDGQEIIAAARAGGSASVVTEMMEGWYPPEDPGRRYSRRAEPGRFVFVHGHYDSWDVGVGDNATGDATLLELARVLWATGADCGARCASPGGPATPPGAMPARPGSPTPSRSISTRTASRRSIAIRPAAAGRRATTRPPAWRKRGPTWRGRSRTSPARRRSSSGPNQAGDYSFNNIGFSSYYMLSSTMPDDLRAEKNYYAVSGCGGNIAWHTENDTIEIADRAILDTDIRIYLLSVLRHANAEILPVDWRAAVGGVRGDARLLSSRPPPTMPISRRRAPRSRGSRSGLRRSTRRSTRDGSRPDAANEALMRLARVLVPINFTREPRFRHDPAYTVPPLPTLAVATELSRLDGPRLGFAKTQLLRGQNRFVGAMNEAGRIIDRALQG